MRPQHLFLRYDVHGIYPSELEFTTFSHERWSPQHFLPTDGVHSIHSQEMESKAVSTERWCPQHLLTTYGVNRIYISELASILFVDLVSPSSSSLVHIIYKGEEKSTALTTYGVHSIDSQYMIYTAFTLKKWSALYILMRYGFRSIYSGPSRNGFHSF